MAPSRFPFSTWWTALLNKVSLPKALRTLSVCQLDLSMVFTAHAQFCFLYGANVDIAVNGSFVFQQGVCGFFLRYTRVHKKIVLVSIAKPVTCISRNYNYLTYNFLVFVFTAKKATCTHNEKKSCH